MSFYSYLHCWKDFNGMKKPGVAAPGFLLYKENPALDAGFREA